MKLKDLIHKIEERVPTTSALSWDNVGLLVGDENQEIHKDADWQDKMIEIELRVSELDGYKDIAFFHHLILEKK